MLLFCLKSLIHLKLNSFIFANSAKSEPNSDIEDQKFVILFCFSFPLILGTWKYRICLYFGKMLSWMIPLLRVHSYIVLAE